MTAPGFPTAQVDARLGEVRAAVDHMGGNLLEFETDPVRLLLDGATLTGATAAAWGGSGERIAELWAGHTALSRLVEQAVELRGAKRKLGDRERQRLEGLLWGPSIPDPTGSGAAPARARAELTGSGTVPLLTVDVVVATLSAAYGRLSDMVSRAGEVWDDAMPRLNVLNTTLEQAEERARAAGARNPNEVTIVHHRLKGLRERAMTDPLSVAAGEVDTAGADVVRAVAHLDDSTREAVELDVSLAEAAAELDGIAARLAEAMSDAAESEAKLARWRRPAVDLDRCTDDLTRLRADLEHVRAGLDPAFRGAAADRLRSLRSRAAGVDAEAVRLATACRNGLTARGELRGRLDAYRVRAGAIGRAEDLDLDRIRQAAEQALYSAPCDLIAAGRLVTAYQEAVRRAAGPGTEDR